MMDLSAAEVAAAVGGQIVQGRAEARLRGVGIDSRRVAPGSLFVPLPGARVDGHDFIPAALQTGARGVLTARDSLPLDTRDRGSADPDPDTPVVIRIDEPLPALQRLAGAWRQRLRAHVVGIAGSNGKTTTKEVVAAVLASRLRTFATPGNENSQIGTPLAILAAPHDVEALVLELGTSMPGELGQLAQFARPDLAIITAAFAEHLEFLGSLDGVIAAETEILDHLAAGAPALVGSAEPALVRAARTRSTIALRSLGVGRDDDLQLAAIEPTRNGTRFQLSGAGLATLGGRFDGRVPLLGEPAAWAAAFAVAVGDHFGLRAEEIHRGLAAARPAAHRLVPRPHGSRPIFVLDDCYNANPASCLAAVRALRAVASPAERLVLVLGDMLELGEVTAAAHHELGTAVSDLVPPGTILIAVGPASRDTARSAAAAGLPSETLPDAAAASARVLEILGDGVPSLVLVKGSRGIALERTVDAILGSS